jgi:hypothetical protein
VTTPMPYRPIVCVCGELEVAHNIRANGTRGACSVSRGPKATPCGCKAFRAVEAVAS